MGRLAVFRKFKLDPAWERQPRSGRGGPGQIWLRISGPGWAGAPELDPQFVQEILGVLGWVTHNVVSRWLAIPMDQGTMMSHKCWK